MSKFHRLLLFFAVGVLLGTPGRAFAQLQVTAPPEVNVFVFVKAKKFPTGPAVAANMVPAGTELQVVVVNCDDEIEIVLTARGERNPECEDPPPPGTTRDCTCNETGIFIIFGKHKTFALTSAGNVLVDGVQVGTVNLPDDDDGGGAVGWLIDIDFGAARMNNADKSCTEVISGFPAGFSPTCSKDANVGFFSVDGGITFARVLGFKVGYLNLGEVTLEASGTSGNRTARQTGFFGPTRVVTLAGVVRIPIGRVALFGEVGAGIWSAESGSEFTGTIGNQTISERFDQKNSGVNLLLGGGVEIWITRVAGISFGVKSIALSDEAGNADEGDVDERFTAFFVGLKFGRP